MENNYFNPNLEDLYIGYEGEINWNLGYQDNYVPFKIKIQDENFAYTDEISEIINAMHDGYAEVRVPYLTKEQIIAEGWEHTGGKLLESAEQLFDKGNYMCSYTYSNSHIVFLVRDPSLVEDYYKDPTFRGECKDINTFRLICKLLNI